VTKHEFIFSSQRSYMVTRHLLFWITWLVLYAVLFHYPIHSFYGWKIGGEQTNTIRKLGLPVFILKTLVINCFLSVVLPQIIFSYLFIYWFLPQFFYKRRNFLITGAVVVFSLVVYLFVAAVFKYATPLLNYMLRFSDFLLEFDIRIFIQVILRDQLITLPIVTGIAVMIKLIKRWWLKQKETEQLAKEKAKAELQLLKAQIHPHFLFNTLNNIYFFVLSNSDRAPEMIKRLSGMLYYILNECNQPLVSLKKELDMIHDYTVLEKIRYGEQLQMIVDVSDKIPERLIAPLLLIPFVENSFKHGASKMIVRPWIKLNVRVEEEFLYFSIMNSKPQTISKSSVKGNIGLRNVKKRLQLLYPENYELDIREEAESFTVRLKIKLQATTSLVSGEEIKKIAEHAVA
jgi:sensor histidine kinase YesM